MHAYVNVEDTYRLQDNQGLGFYGFGQGGSCGCSMGYPPNVLKSTPVYDDLDGEVVGWVTRDQYVRVDAIDSDWARVQFSWLFDTAEVWIRTSDILPPPKPRVSLLNQIHFERNPPQTTADWDIEGLNPLNNSGLGGLISDKN